MKRRKTVAGRHGVTVLWPAAAAGVLSAAGLWLVPAGHAAAQTAPTVVALGQVVGLVPPVNTATDRTLATPVAGYDVVADVSGVGFDTSATDADGTLDAAPGDQLLILSVGLATYLPPFQTSGSGLPAPALTVTDGAVTAGLPVSPDSDGEGFDGEWAIGIPSGSDPVLALTSSGYTQRIDLRTGDRVGPAPEVLYRSLDPSDLEDTLDQTEAYTGTGPDGAVSVTLGVGQASLTFFYPDTQTAADLPDDEALLVVAVGAQMPTTANGDSASFDQNNPFPVALALGAGTALNPNPITPRKIVSTDNTTGNGLVDGIYEFVVPASLTGAQVLIGPPSGMTATVTKPDGSTSDGPVAFTGPAQFTLSFPAPFPGSVAPTTTAPPSTTTAPAVTTPPLSTATPNTIGGRAIAGAHRQAGPVALQVTGGGGVNGVPLIAGLAGTGGAVVVIGLVVWERKSAKVRPRPVTGSLETLLDPLPVETPPAQAAFPAIPLPPGAEVADQALGKADRNEGFPGPPLVIRVLGPVEIEGVTSTLRLSSPYRILLLLALAQGHGLSTDQLRHFLASKQDKEPTVGSLRTWVSSLRRHLPPETLPEKTNSGYELADTVEVDWDQFRALATRAAAQQGADRVELAGRALSLVRGPALDGVELWHGVHRPLYGIATQIEELASSTAERALELGWAQAAAHAARQGLKASPQVPGLWKLRLRAAAAGSGEGLTPVFEAIDEETQRDHPDIEALYQRLRGGA